MEKFIAVVDDEEDILELVSVNLKKNGFAVKGFVKPADFFKFLKKHLPDLVILDLMLPDTDGLEICKLLKNDIKTSAIPIIMLSAKSEETDKIVGLELGADDYVTKPFSPKELVARVKVALRKTEARTTGKKLSIGQISIDEEKYEAQASGKKIELTAKEFKLLLLLISKKGHVFSRDNILDFVWGGEALILDRTVDVHINNLREKLGKAGQMIKNVRGVGYKIEE